jgi:class 3 adenylate cyclase
MANKNSQRDYQIVREYYENWQDDHARATKSGARLMDHIKTHLDEVEDPHQRNPHLAAYQKFGESNVPIILFMDIIDYSKLSFDKEQKRAIDLLNDAVRTALKAVHCQWEDVVCLPTGDGMCLCFITGTDIPLRVAAEVQKVLARKNRARRRNGKGSRKEICVRMGIHLGNVLRIDDLKRSYNLAGSAINLAQRAMDCGGKGHILCTTAAYRQLVGIEKQYKQRLKAFEKPFKIKHNLLLRLYNYCTEDGIGNPKDPRE